MGDGISPLYIASQRGHEIIIHILLDSGAQVNLRNKYNIDDISSPLKASCFAGYDSIVQYLLKIAAALDLCDNSGSGSLYRTCQFGHKNNMQFFLDDNANVNSCIKIGASPLYGACENGHGDVVHFY